MVDGVEVIIMMLIKVGNWELRRIYKRHNGIGIWHLKCPTWDRHVKGWGSRAARAAGPPMTPTDTDISKCWHCNRPIPEEMQALFILHNDLV